MKWVLIRHGQTAGNLEHRYIGCRTDEPLCEAGKAALLSQDYPPVTRVYVSPMTRCLETAKLIYPRHTPIVVEDFRECDFGAFEGKNYAELNVDPDYQRWIDSGGELPFPGGESRANFAKRCAAAFANLNTGEDAALIVHGGTVMAIMEAYASPKGCYFDFRVKNGSGFVLYEDGRYEPIENADAGS